MLTKLKNIGRYIGRGCVHWDGKYDHKPYKCVIVEVRVNTTYVDEGYGVREKRKTEFVIWNKRLRKRFTVDDIELFDNFRECYRCICEYSSYGSLCDLQRYGVCNEDGAKVEVVEKIENALALVKNAYHRSNKKSLGDFKNEIVGICNESLKSLKGVKAETNYDYLRRHTLYGFIREMMKRYPNMDANRAHRMSEIVFGEEE